MSVPIYGFPRRAEASIRKTITTSTTQSQQPSAPLRIMSEYVVRNTNILKQLDDQMNKDKALDRLNLLKDEIALKLESITRTGSK